MAMVVDPMRCVGRKRRMAAHAQIPGGYMARLYQGTCSKVPALRHQRRTLASTVLTAVQYSLRAVCRRNQAATVRCKPPAVHLCSCSLFAPPAARNSVENKTKSTRRTRFAGAATLAQLRQSQKCYPKSRADGRYLHPPRQLT